MPRGERERDVRDGGAAEARSQSQLASVSATHAVTPNPSPVAPVGTREALEEVAAWLAQKAKRSREKGARNAGVKPEADASRRKALLALRCVRAIQAMQEGRVVVSLERAPEHVGAEWWWCAVRDADAEVAFGTDLLTAIESASARATGGEDHA